MGRWTLAASALATVLGGCAAQGPIWDKPGGTAQQFNVDKYQCVHENQGGAVAVPVGNMVAAVPVTNWDMYNACMMARGYSMRR
jgi:hypothetical protein